MVSSRLLFTIVIFALLIASVSSQQQQGGVSWDSAPECPDSGGGTAVDTQGRSWGWFNGQSCKRSGSKASTTTAAQQQAQQQAIWDSAPPCSYQATSDNSKPDSQGRLWGWQEGRSCRHTGSSVSSSSSSPSPPRITWESAPPCNYQPTLTNSRPDISGRYWGWQNGISCTFNQPPQNIPPPSPPGPSPFPAPPMPPSPRVQPAPQSPLPKQQQPSVRVSPKGEIDLGLFQWGGVAGMVSIGVASGQGRSSGLWGRHLCLSSLGHSQKVS